ncbi:hypothetical protein [Haliscomenobacter sp.]|uniref:hypothetical protein n=1 Tax=Haliscomenobacter sp. TaxID=2717303 RepID=UPI003593FA7C
MGAWAHGHFEDDSAWHFIAEIEEAQFIPLENNVLFQKLQAISLSLILALGSFTHDHSRSKLDKNNASFHTMCFKTKPTTPASPK